MRAASSALLRESFFIDSFLCFVGAAHADNARVYATLGKNDRMQRMIENPDGRISDLAVFVARAVNKNGVEPVEFFGACERYAMFLLVIARPLENPKKLFSAMR
jgi:hypothetical protein